MANENFDREVKFEKSANFSQVNVFKLPCAANILAQEVPAHRVFARRNGQDLAGSGALVFEGELLEFPVWN